MTTRHHILLRLAAALFALAAFGACSDDLTEEVQPVAEPQTTTFEWVKAADVSTRTAFLRNFGVGFSYDAVHGSFCNWKDIRCQIINRKQLDWVEQLTGTQYWFTSTLEYASQKSEFRFNQRDYVAAIQINTATAIDLGLYNHEKRTRQDVLEDGVREQFYYLTEEQYQMGEQRLQVAQILSRVRYGDFDLFTRSFQNAIQHLAEVGCNAYAVDSFLNVYGTHVVTDARLGGKLRIELSNTLWRYNDKVSETAWTKEQLFWAYSHKEEARQNEEYKWMEDSRINLSATGGDQSMLTPLLGPANFEGKRQFSIEPVLQWARSITYDPNDETNSNAEMIGMSVRPIWDFIAAIDEEVAEAVHTAVMQEVDYQQRLIGEKNFFNARFPVQHPTTSCRYRGSSEQYESAQFVSAEDTLLSVGVNVVQDGKVIANVCHECIDDLWYWVAYPVYEGCVRQTNGLAVRDGSAWNVRYIDGRATLTRLPAEEVPQTETFYINEGALSLTPVEGFVYRDCHVMAQVEPDGGVQTSGSVRCQPCPVVKRGDQFMISPLYATTTRTFAGYTWSDKWHTWLRNANYTYIYNPSEIDYEQ